MAGKLARLPECALGMGASAGELRRDRSEDAAIADSVFALEPGEPLKVNPRPVGLEPVEDFVEEPDIMPEDYYPDPERDKKYENFAKAAMLFIVGAGGFFGTFMAIVLPAPPSITPPGRFERLE